VDYVLEGSARRDGPKVRVSAQLIRVSDQTHVWAHSYDRELHDVLVLQNDLGSAIAEQVRLELTPGQKSELAKARDVDPDAYEAYLKGRHFWYQFRPDSLNKAIDYYKQALDKDPNYAPAYAGLAAAYSVRANFFTNPAEDYPKAKAAAQRALELDDALSQAHESMAAVHIFYDWDWAAADHELTRSEELNPPSQEYSLRSYWFESRGDADGAISALKRGLRFDPFNPLLNIELGNAYYYARHPDDAISQYLKAREIDPNFPLGRGGIGAAYEEKGDLAAAAVEYRKIGDSVSLAVVQAKQGNPSAARQLLRQLNGAKQSPEPYSMARLNAALGDKNAAFNWLKTAYEGRAPWLIWLTVDPRYDKLRSDPRFQELLRVMRFRQ
jgi:tetratricopeptide (TPR) repeat protein